VALRAPAGSASHRLVGEGDGVVGIRDGRIAAYIAIMALAFAIATTAFGDSLLLWVALSAGSLGVWKGEGSVEDEVGADVGGRPSCGVLGIGRLQALDRQSRSTIAKVFHDLRGPIASRPGAITLPPLGDPTEENSAAILGALADPRAARRIAVGEPDARGIPHPVGEYHPKARLSDADVEAIRQEYEAHPEGHPLHVGYRALASKWGVGKRTIRDIVNMNRRNVWAERWVVPRRANVKSQRR